MGASLDVLKFLPRIDDAGFQLSFNVEKFYDPLYIFYAIDIQVVLPQPLPGHSVSEDESFKALFACTDGDG